MSQQRKQELIPFTRTLFPSFIRHLSLFDQDFEGLESATTASSDVYISEDERHVYVTADLPGLSQTDVEVIWDKGVLWIKGEKEETEEDRKRKHYRKARRSFSYRVMVPGEIDESAEPQAQFKNGVIEVTFPKSKKAQPKKIQVK